MSPRLAALLLPRAGGPLKHGIAHRARIAGRTESADAAARHFGMAVEETLIER